MYTTKDVLDAVLKIGNANPGFTYTPYGVDDDGKPIFVEPGKGSCNYLPDERNPQGCIVGAALTSLGLIDPDSFEGEGEKAHVVVRRALSLDEAQDDQDEDDPVLATINRIQGYQDAGEPWGVAIKGAARLGTD